MSNTSALATVQWFWTAWIVYWFVSALRVRRTVKREPWWQRMSTIGTMLVAVVLLGYLGIELGILNKRFAPDTDGVRIGGLALTAAGLIFTVWARIHLGQFWSARVALKEGHELIQTGPYAWVRHPIYSGLLVATAGSALVIGEWRAVLGTILIWLVLYLKAQREERLLSREFGDAYARYREHTGALLPKLVVSPRTGQE